MDDTTVPFRDTLAGRFLTAPFRLSSYANLAFLALAFPLGLAYFIFLAVGFPLGFGLTIVWVGLPILAVVFGGAWLFARFERFLAIKLLGADVPPMAPPAGPTPLGFWARIKAFLSNPVTWKGLGYLSVKFPLGIATFVMFVTLTTVTLSFLLAPFYYAWLPIPPSFEFDLWSWEIDSFGEALAVSGIGALMALLTINLFNLVAWGWRELAAALLGSRRFATPAASTPSAPEVATEAA